MEKQNVEYVPPTKEQEAMNAERLGMTQKEKVKKLLRQYENLKTEDDLKDIVDVFDVSDEEAKHKVLSNDLKELVEKMKYLTSEGMPDNKDISAIDVDKLELGLKKRYGEDPVDPLKTPSHLATYLYRHHIRFWI